MEEETSADEQVKSYVVYGEERVILMARVEATNRFEALAAAMDTDTVEWKEKRSDVVATSVEPAS